MGSSSKQLVAWSGSIYVQITIFSSHEASFPRAQEVMRIEFMKNRSTVRNTHVNEITGKIDEYWFDEGSLFPPSGRAGRSEPCRIKGRKFRRFVKLVFAPAALPIQIFNPSFLNRRFPLISSAVILKSSNLNPKPSTRRCLLTYAVIFALDVLSIFFTIFVYEHAVHPQLSVKDTVTGSFVGGLLFSSLAMTLDKVFDNLVGKLIEFENWATETQVRDA